MHDLLDDDDDNEMHFPLKMRAQLTAEGSEQRPGLIGLLLSYECSHFHAFQMEGLVIMHKNDTRPMCALNTWLGMMCTVHTGLIFFLHAYMHANSDVCHIAINYEAQTFRLWSS